jgi:hypothetical protein
MQRLPGMGRAKQNKAPATINVLTLLITNSQVGDLEVPCCTTAGSFASRMSCRLRGLASLALSRTRLAMACDQKVSNK